MIRYADHTTEKNRTAQLLFLAVFLTVSLFFIESGEPNELREYHSSSLTKTVYKTGGQETTVYKNQNGDISFASDAGYAVKTVTITPAGKLESFYDENNEPVEQSEKYYSVMHEYDQLGRETSTTYLDADGKPTNTSGGYAVSKNTYDKSGRIEMKRYYDVSDIPACSEYFGYAKKYEYSDDGTLKVSYLDEKGNPMRTVLGYAIMIQSYYLSEGKDNGKIRDEFYYDEKGMPIPIYLGQYGVHYEYNELGQKIRTVFLDADGKPIITAKGYTSTVYTYDQDDGSRKELYYDLSGNPYRKPEGQYGISYQNGQEEYLNADGSRQFNLKRLLYNQSRFAIPAAFLLVCASVAANRKTNILLLIISVLSIVYLTLLFRNPGKEKGFMPLFRLYGQAMTNAGIRSDILRNIWLFIPLGSILFRLYPKKRILLIPVAISIIIETIQCLTGTGFCEPDDVISNSAGGIIGYCMSDVLTKTRTIQLVQKKRSDR